MESTELASLFEPFHLSRNFNCRDFSALCSSLVFLCASRCSPGALLKSIFAGRGRGGQFFVHFCTLCIFLHFCRLCIFVHFCRLCTFCALLLGVKFLHFCRLCIFCALLLQGVHFRQFLALQSCSPGGRYQR